MKHEKRIGGGSGVSVRIALALLTLALLVEQWWSIMIYPVIDTGMWFGDESWTMLTLRAMIMSGVARVPEALGSSLEISNGFVNGCVWISALLYGLPALLFRSLASPVAIGRVISSVLSLIILFVLYRLMRALQISRAVSLFAILLLVASDAFAFSSHSARLDVITGLAVIVMLLWLVRLHRSPSARSSAWTLFALGFAVTFSLAVYVHVPTLIALPTAYAFVRLGCYRSARNWFAIVAGAALGAVLLLVAYHLTSGPIELLGSGYNQYYNVANSLPILHPFSWQVQKINTIDRAVQVWQVAWPLVLGLAAGSLSMLRKTSRSALTQAQRFYLELAACVLISWMLTEGPAVFYNIHFLPVLTVVIAILFEHTAPRPLIAVAVSAAIITSVGIWTLYSRAGVGRELTRQNTAAIDTLLSHVPSGSLILTDQPAMNPVAQRSDVRLMTNHLLLFGRENKPLPDILQEKGVNYLLLYATSRWQSPFREIADSLYVPADMVTGFLTDQARGYDAPDWQHRDTLRLYAHR